MPAAKSVLMWINGIRRHLSRCLTCAGTEPRAPVENPATGGFAGSGTRGAAPTDLAPTHHRLLGEDLYVCCVVRFFLAFGILFGALAAFYLLDIRGIGLKGILLVAACLFLYNFGLFPFARHGRAAEVTPEARRILVSVMNATIFLDYLFLTVVLWLIGGLQSPFRIFYLSHIVLACMLLPLGAAYVHAAIGYAMYALLVAAEWRGWIPRFYALGAVASAEPPDGRYVITVLTSQGILLAVPLFFLMGLTRKLREGEARLRQAHHEIARYSEMQRNFLQIAVHDVKAPVAAAQSFLDNLEAGVGGEPSGGQRSLIAGAQRRLSDLTRLLRDFEILAVLDSDQLDRQAQNVDIGNMLWEITDEYRDLAEAHHHQLATDAEAGAAVVHAIPRLLKEAVANLVTNAIKYTPDGGKIGLRSRAGERTVVIEVKDNGAGIAPEDRDRLFQDFVRLRRSHTPKAEGSGLGLSIVRRVAEMHGGSVTVDSELHLGSVFRLELPRAARPKGDA